MLNLLNKKKTDDTNCDDDGKKPKFFSIIKLLKIRKDKRFKKILTRAAAYFKSVCHETQVWYIKTRVSEMLKMSAEQRAAFIGRLKANGFKEEDVDERISKSLAQVMEITSKHVEHHH